MSITRSRGSFIALSHGRDAAGAVWVVVISRWPGPNQRIAVEEVGRA